MKNLIKFELRKILTKRFAVISVAAVLLLSLILSFSTLHSMYAFDGNGAEETGKAAVEIDKQIALKYEGKLTDNKVQQMMSEFKPTQDLHGMNAKYIYQNALQSSVFSHFADIDGNWNGLSVADVFGDKEIKVGYVNGWLSTSQNTSSERHIGNLEQSFYTVDIRQSCLLWKDCLWQKNTRKGKRYKK